MTPPQSRPILRFLSRQCEQPIIAQRRNRRAEHFIISAGADGHAHLTVDCVIARCSFTHTCISRVPRRPRLLRCLYPTGRKRHQRTRRIRNRERRHGNCKYAKGKT